MAAHYSQPKGFVGRQLFYRIEFQGMLYGCLAFGSAVKHLPARCFAYPLNEGLNNIFYHVEPITGKYPFRNFTIKALLEAEKRAAADYFEKYGDKVRWFESLVELPRTGEIYKRAGYSYYGITKGFTCKRDGIIGTDSWSGARRWDTQNLRPKRVFIKECYH